LKRLLLLMTTRTYRSRAFMEAAARIQVPVVVGSDRPQVLQAHNPAGHLTIPFADRERAVGIIAEYGARHPLGAIVAADDDGALLAARAAEALGLRHTSAASVAAARDKSRTRHALERAGLPVPWWFTLPIDASPEDALERASFPCVVKPLSLAASRGVIRADDPGEFVAACRRVAAIVAEAGPDAGGRSLLVEGYLDGGEMALEGILEDGHLRRLAFYDKPDPLVGPFFEETLYITPSRREPEIQREVERTAARVTAALGLTEGPVHVEVRINDEGVWPLEIAPRTIGGLCARTLRFDGGVALEEIVLRRALGLPIASHELEDRAAGVMMIPIPRSGILRGVGGLDEARGVPGIEDVLITIPPGQPIVALPEGSRYLGFIFARESTPQRVESILRKSHHQLVFDITPVDRGAGSM